MERRPFFVFGDLLTNVVIGGCSALLVSSAVSPGWGMFVAMFVGMVLGMLLALMMSFFFIPFFGAMEVMIPAMTTGMVAGMVAGHMASAGSPSHTDLAFVGSLLGAVVLILTYAVNAFLTGEATK